MDHMRILFAGTPQAAVTPLKVLSQAGGDLQLVGVLTRPDAPSGRGRKLTPSPVKEAAQELGLPGIEASPDSEEFFEQIEALHPDLAAVVAYGKILKPPALNALPLGWYNLHFSLLPQYRGAAPVQRAIWAGEEITGATVFKIGPGLDDGPILAQSTVEIGPQETAGELLDRLSTDGAYLLAAALQGLAEGKISTHDQKEGVFETAPKIHPADAHIRFDVPAFAADRQIRACTPQPGAWCRVHRGDDPGRDDPGRDSLGGDDVGGDDPAWNAANKPISGHGTGSGITMTLGRAHIDKSNNPSRPPRLSPGQVAVTKKHVWVGTLTDPLELDLVKPQGKKMMKAADWARGAHLSPRAYCD